MPIIAHDTRMADRRTAKPTRRQYFSPMTATVQAVAAALRVRRPGMGVSKLHSLLYLGQGHHLADLSEPLFGEPIYATAEGVEVEDLGAGGTPAELSNAHLNTVDYVISRYGNLSAADVRTLVRGTDPWQLATRRTEDLRIELAWMQDAFRRAASRVEEGELVLSREQIRDLATRAAAQSVGPGKTTTREDLLARVAAARERSASAP